MEKILKKLDLSNLSNEEINKILVDLYSYGGFDLDNESWNNELFKLFLEYGNVFSDVLLFSDIFSSNISKDDKFKLLSKLNLNKFENEFNLIKGMSIEELSIKYDEEFEENEFKDYNNFGDYMNKVWFKFIEK